MRGCLLQNKVIQMIRNFSFTISSNLITLIISTIVVIVFPKLIGVEEYGYWQLYLFYLSYIGFLHFGWSDGIYLRYGGEEYNDLNKKVFSSQFYIMILFQFVLAIFIILFSLLFLNDAKRAFIFNMIALNAIIINVLSVLSLTLQATNRIKEYAQINIISRVTYVFLILMFIAIGFNEFRIMIIADLIGKTLSLIYAMYVCKDIVFIKLTFLSFDVLEMTQNIKAGMKLMLANIASMLIIGVVRIGIEYSWDVSTFGKISLTLSISNLFMLFINSTGIVIFPLLRKIGSEALPRVYLVFRDILMLILFFVLILYFPVSVFLAKWLPNYANSLMFMALLFPISLYEGKMGLLINTFLKTLREEKYIMKINIIVLLLSILLTIFTSVIFRNLNFAVLTILIVISLRSILAEFYLSRILKINIIRDIIFESILTLLFILIGWNMNSNYGFISYSFTLGLYVFLKRNNLKNSFCLMKSYFRS